MFRYLLDRLCLVALSAYLFNKFLLKPTLPKGEVFFRGYFNDLLLIPVALPMVLCVLRLVGIRKHDLPPTREETLTALFVWSLMSEVIGPVFFPKTTGDPSDILAYAVGAFIAFYLWNRRPQGRLSNNL